MHLNAKRPKLCPAEYSKLLDTMSKAALMDLSWKLTRDLEGNSAHPNEVWIALRIRADTVLSQRDDRNRLHD